MRNTYSFVMLLIGALFCFQPLSNAQTFTFTGPLAIPDASCPVETLADIAVTGIGTIDGLATQLSEVCIDITHTFDADLEISLRAPDGTTIPLSLDNGGGGDNYTGTCFSEAGPDGPIDGGTAPFMGNYTPEGDLTMFNGVNADGTWSLVLCDDAGADTGTLNSWSIMFFSPGPADVGAIGFTNPSTTCGLTDMEAVTIVIENFGTMDQDSFDVSYTVAGNPVVTEMFIGPIASGATATFTFSTLADFSMLGPITITGATDLQGDANTFNDAIVVNVEHLPLINTFPLIEDFESFTLCGNGFDPCNFDCQTAVANFFMQDDTDEDDWRIDDGATPSGGTGPTQDNNPGTITGKYLFTEASGCNGVTSNLISPCMDVSALGNPFVDFYVHMHGDDMGTMNLDITTDGGVTWTNLWTQTGQIQINMADPWELQEVSLGAPSGTIQLRWQGITGPGFESDMSLDDIRIYDRPDTDVGVLSIDSLESGCGLLPMQPVFITLTNLSNMPVTSIPIEAQVNGGGFMTVGSYSGSIPPGGTDIYSFPLDLSAVGTYDIDVISVFPGDGDPTNDTASISVEQIAPINVFPWTEDFETFTECGNSFDPCDFDCSAAVANNWVQDEGEGDDWRVDFGGTPSGGTGPAMDNNPGTDQGKYLFTEASGCNNVISNIITPCMDVSGLNNPFVDFYIHMFGDDQGTMNLDISLDDGATWSNLWTTTGQLQTADSDPWALQEVSLQNPGGVIKLRWQGVTGPGFESDMGLDDIRVYDRPDVDVEVVSVDSPANGCTLSDMTPVTITLKNISVDPVTDIPIEAQVNGGGFVSVGLYGGPLGSGLTDTYTFMLDLTPPMVYTIDVRSVFPGDGDPSNDMASRTVFPPVTTFPWTEDFETWTECGNTFDPCPFDCSTAVANDWVQSSTDDDDWRVDFGSTPSGPGSTGPSMDNNPGTDTGQFLFTEASSGCDNLSSHIITPCLDISSMNNPFVDFYIHMHGSDMGSMSLSASMDAGVTWTQLWTTSGELQMAATDPWELVSAQILGVSGVILLRWEGTTAVGFEGDMALDDIRVYDRPDYDVNVVDITTPVDGCGLLPDEPVTIILESLSIGDTSMVPVAYQVNAGPIVVDTFPGTISPGTDETFTFEVGADLSTPGLYTITAWTELEADGDHTNDTFSIQVNSIPFINTFPYQIGWEGGPAGWSSEGENNTWDLGIPAAPIINTAAEGLNAWVTNLSGVYNNNEESYLVSPCFDFSGLPVDPAVRFAIWYETENNFDECWLEVSYDAGATFQKVGTAGTGVNWYNDAGNDWWEDSSGGWLVAENELTGSAGMGDVVFRFVFDSDFTVQDEGLAIDDFQIIPPLDFDVEVTSPLGEYTMVPARQQNVVIRTVVENIGLMAQSNIIADFEILDDMSNVVYNGSGSVAALAAGSRVQISPVDPFYAPAIGDYTMNVSVTTDNDEDLSNNVGSFPFTVTGTLFARDDGDLSAGTSLGIGGGGNDNGQLGQNFELVEDDVMTSVTFRLVSPPTGDVIIANVYDTNPDGSPNMLIASTEPYVISPADNTNGVTLTLDIDGGPLPLTAGTYYLGVIEPGDNITLATLVNIFTPETTWLRWDGNPNGPTVWSNNEDFGFDLTYYLRANFETCLTPTLEAVGIVSNETLDGEDNGEIELVLPNGVPPYDFNWSNGASTQTISDLPDGMYTVLIEDVLGCIDSLTFEVLPGCAGLNLITNVLDETVAGANDGAIDLTITMGIFTPPFTYMWDNGETTQDIEGLAPGTYCVEVMDVFGCAGFLCASVLPGCGPLGLNTEVTFETVPGSNDGTIDLTVSAGTPPYTYIWDNGATTEDIAALAPGMYCVTVTDFHGCVDETCADIFIVSVNNITGLTSIELYPNPTSNETSLALEFERVVDARVEIVNLLGQQLQSLELTAIKSDVVELDVRNYQSGVYYVRVIVDGESAVKPLMIGR